MPIESQQLQTNASQQYINIADEYSPARLTYHPSTSAAGDTSTVNAKGSYSVINGSAPPINATTLHSELFYHRNMTVNQNSIALSSDRGSLEIAGVSLLYEGTRVKSYLLGRDLNPMGRGDGALYAEGMFSAGNTRPISINLSYVGIGNSISNLVLPYGGRFYPIDYPYLNYNCEGAYAYKGYCADQLGQEIGEPPIEICANMVHFHDGAYYSPFCGPDRFPPAEGLVFDSNCDLFKMWYPSHFMHFANAFHRIVSLISAMAKLPLIYSKYAVRISNTGRSLLSPNILGQYTFSYELFNAIIRLSLGVSKLKVICNCSISGSDDVDTSNCGLSYSTDNQGPNYVIRLCYSATHDHDTMGTNPGCILGGAAQPGGVIAHEFAHAVNQRFTYEKTGGASASGTELYAESFRRVFDTLGSGGVWGTNRIFHSDEFRVKVYNIYSNTKCDGGVDETVISNEKANVISSFWCISGILDKDKSHAATSIYYAYGNCPNQLKEWQP
jgi:hypothetical protein